MKIGLVGYGKMGKQIFNLLSSLNCPITVVVINEEEKEKSKAMLDRRLRRALRKELISQDQFQEKSSSLSFTTSLNDLKDHNLVIESIFEDFKEKVRLFQQLESILSPLAMITTNTSSLSTNALAEGLKYGKRFCGFHFFHPLPLVNIVEIIRWEGVSVETVDYLLELGRKMGTKPLAVNDAPSSAVNGILAYHYCEALYILEQGLALPSKIDELTRRFLRVGPCESMDIIGIKLLTQTIERTVNDRSEGMLMPELLYKMLSEGRLGRDWGKGLFIYHETKVEDSDPEFYLVLGQKHSLKGSSPDEAAISKRLLYSIFNGFLYILSRGTFVAEEMDMAIREVLGMQEGPWTMMKHIGKDKLEQEFDLLSQEVGLRFGQPFVHRMCEAFL